MAADPPPKPSSDPHPNSDPPAPAPAPASVRRLSVATAGILVAVGLNLALCLHLRLHRGAGAGDLAFVGLSHLNLLLLFLSLRLFERSPPGSEARGRAMLAVWLLTATLAAAFTWKIGALMPPAFAVAAWAMAAATVLIGGLCVMFILHRDRQVK